MNSQIRILTDSAHSYEVLLRGEINYWCIYPMEYGLFNTSYDDYDVIAIFQL